MQYEAREAVDYRTSGDIRFIFINDNISQQLKSEIGSKLHSVNDNYYRDFAQQNTEDLSDAASSTMDQGVADENLMESSSVDYHSDHTYSGVDSPINDDDDDCIMVTDNSTAENYAEEERMNLSTATSEQSLTPEAVITKIHQVNEILPYTQRSTAVLQTEMEEARNNYPPDYERASNSSPNPTEQDEMRNQAHEAAVQVFRTHSLQSDPGCDQPNEMENQEYDDEAPEQLVSRAYSLPTNPGYGQNILTPDLTPSQTYTYLQNTPVDLAEPWTVFSQPKTEFFCRICNIDYYSKTNLYQHQRRRHTINVRDMCEVCGKVYLRDDLRKHQRRMHTCTYNMPEPKEYQCSYNHCSAKYRSKSSLVDHYDQHHEQIKNYTCHCGKRCYSLIGLKCHYTWIHCPTTPLF